MPNFKENPGGMKPSGFKMKNSALNMSARTGSPMHANYGGGESPAKFISGLLKGLNKVTRVVDKGARGVRRKVRNTVKKVVGKVTNRKNKSNTTSSTPTPTSGSTGSMPSVTTKAVNSAAPNIKTKSTGIFAGAVENLKKKKDAQS